MSSARSMKIEVCGKSARPVQTQFAHGGAGEIMQWHVIGYSIADEIVNRTSYVYNLMIDRGI